MSGMELLNRMRPTVALDQDGTLENWSERFAEILLDLDPNFPVIPEGQRVGFDYFWTDEADPITIMKALNDPRLYDGLKPFPGVVEAVREMESMGIHSFVCSTPTWTNPGCVPGKLASIQKLFGEGWDKRLILTHDKTTIMAHALVDDKPEITGAHQPIWTHVMHHQDYNSHIDTPHRLTSWWDWKDVILPLLETAKVA